MFICRQVTNQSVASAAFSVLKYIKPRILLILSKHATNKLHSRQMCKYTTVSVSIPPLRDIWVLSRFWMSLCLSQLLTSKGDGNDDYLPHIDSRKIK